MVDTVGSLGPREMIPWNLQCTKPEGRTEFIDDIDNDGENPPGLRCLILPASTKDLHRRLLKTSFLGKPVRHAAFDLSAFNCVSDVVAAVVVAAMAMPVALT
ncbi:hypothetical protein EGR_07828 [Echinococcus granulosus]|uniref:Uncharacterized protein n=1 Tax=Echinococcus granulosus TaxID=6210 RepID=W6UGQ1_ECHGR|nr:hypothetical protein EGR_07828 [Echinococcus granulosus]EUB57292.1 hypothetical protein EGR_07828 [Echinococcus granulosus]